MDTTQKPATQTIVTQHEQLARSLPFSDEQDWEDVRRGFLGALDPCVVRAADSRVVWDNDAYAFLDGEAPPTVNPSLWHQSGLTAIQGLFEVVPGIYQSRGRALQLCPGVTG